MATQVLSLYVLGGRPWSSGSVPFGIWSSCRHWQIWQPRPWSKLHCSPLRQWLVAFPGHWFLTLGPQPSPA